MRMSAAGRSKLKQWEGVRYTAYQDSAGIWTNGVGHTGKDVHQGQTVDAAQVEEWLTDDLREAESAVNRLVRVALSQSQFDALVAFVFNVGASAFAGSTLLRKLNAGDYDSVPAELAKWNKITVKGRKVANRGLSNRRAAEAGLWASGEPVAGAEMRPSPPAPKPMRQSNTGRGLAASTIATFGAVATESAEQVQGLADYSETIRWIFIALTFAGIALTAYGFAKARKRNEE